MMHSIRRAAIVVIAAVIPVSVLASCAPPARAPANSTTVNPCTTDAAIACDPTYGHIIAHPVGTPKNKLVVFMHGAGSQPYSYQKVQSILNGNGFHVVNLRIPGTSTAGACPYEVVPDCHRVFRGETTFGENVADPASNGYDHPAITVDNGNSVMNRLLALLDYLNATYPTAGWAQYQVRDGSGACTSTNTTYDACNPVWSKIVLMGHSLGAGEALYLSKFYSVDRVGMLAGPYDEYVDYEAAPPAVTVAPWITEGGFATPASKMYGLVHQEEGNYIGVQTAWDALGMAGPPFLSDYQTPPYSGSHQLTTDLTPLCTGSTQKHLAVAVDLCTPGDIPFLYQPWLWLAGATL
jgi:hypothetical protein